MMNKGRFYRMAAWLALAGFLNAGMAEMLPAEDVLLPAPSACTSDRSAVAHLPLRLAVYAPEKDAPAVEAILNVLNAQGVLSGLSMTRDRDSADVVCSVEGNPAGTGEGYEARLEGGREGRGVLHLKAGAPAGLFYAWQSMVQVLNANRTGEGFSVPVFSIRDVPRFEWRGIMLDVSRHFFTMAEVKRMIDTMSLFKLNRLHLHLTDGPGWRMEIRKYLFSPDERVWRVLANGEWNWQEVKLAIQEHDPEATYGGFYTREQMRKSLPMPAAVRLPLCRNRPSGHSYAAMHAYGDLICDGVDFPVEGKKGRDAVCMGRPETLRFVKDVVDELKAVFPPGSPIHLGHDEVSAEAWKKCRYCQNRLKDLNETDLKALSRDFLQQIADYVRKDGYDAIVWDEAGELEADKHIFVMAWRGTDFAAAAVRKGHPVILAPCSHFYFDYYQSSAPTEPKAIGGLIPLRQVYGYELPELSPEEASKVRGLQANIWTEYLYDMGLVEYMAWPRALALAERAWSDCDPRDYKSFRSRAALALKLLEKLAVKYRPMDEED